MLSLLNPDLEIDETAICFGEVTSRTTSTTFSWLEHVASATQGGVLALYRDFLPDLQHRTATETLSGQRSHRLPGGP